MNTNDDFRIINVNSAAEFDAIKPALEDMFLRSYWLRTIETNKLAIYTYALESRDQEHMLIALARGALFMFRSNN